MKKVTFWYCRHGQTIFNRLNRMQGWCDSPLTENGIHDAMEAGNLLREIPFTAAYSSTSERCRDTTAIILNNRDVPVTHMKGLREMFWGDYEGFCADDDLEEINRRRMGDNDWTDVGGENVPMVHQRIRDTYRKIYEEAEDGDTVLIVSHGAIFMQMMDGLFNIPKDAFFGLRLKKKRPIVPNGFVGGFECVDGTFRLTSLRGEEDADVAALQNPAEAK